MHPMLHLIMDLKAAVEDYKQQISLMVINILTE